MRKYNFFSWHAWLSVALSCLLLRSWLLPLGLQQYSASSSSLHTTHSRFFFFILLLKLNVLLQGVRLVLQWKLQVHFILNIRAFELREGEKKRPKLHTYFNVFFSYKAKKGTGPEIFVHSVWFKTLKKYVKHFRFSLQGVLLNPRESICYEECTAL